MNVSNQVSEIDGVKFTKVKFASDIRGSFIKFHPLQELGPSLDSVALSINPEAGTVRGLHFQVEPFAENKLIACVQGSIFDVIVDLRPGSRTIGKWTSFELSAENEVQVYLPKGIAHGFQTLVPNSIIHYCLSTSYSPESSYSINPHGGLGISWPLKTVSISERDSKGVSIEFAREKYANSIKS
jgi:dTDP-4-dehydrorhamnose 3,5-epimerase